MTKKRQYLGQIGEELACNFLERHSYKILDRNWRSQKFEIDIVALDNNELVVAEVKTRSTFHEDAMEMISVRQLEHLSDAAVQYLEENMLDLSYRIDLIAVEHDALHTSIRQRQDVY